MESHGQARATLSQHGRPKAQSANTAGESHKVPTWQAECHMDSYTTQPSKLYKWESTVRKFQRLKKSVKQKDPTFAYTR